MDKITERLLELQDLKYKEFHSKLIPNVSPQQLMGVRTPMIRKLAKELAGTKEAEGFLKELPHFYYEENNLHGCLLELIKDHGRCIRELERFLPYVDNWATCDMISPKVFQKHTEELLLEIKKWLASEHTYTVRFGIKMLMSFYLGDNFSSEYPDMVADIRSEEYYVNMMIAWYFATALAKQYDAVIGYLKDRRLDTWVHNKTIQKAVESYRITDEQKSALRALRLR